MLSGREQKMAAAIVIAGVLGGGFWVGRFYMDSRAKLAQDIARAEQQANSIAAVARNRVRVEKDWQELLDGGLKFNQSLAQTQAVRAIEKFAADRRVTVEFSTIVNMPRIGEFEPVDMTVKAHGSDLHIVELLYLMESAKFPLRITNVQIAPAKEGKRDLVIATINVTTAAYIEGGKKGGPRG